MSVTQRIGIFGIERKEKISHVLKKRGQWYISPKTWITCQSIKGEDFFLDTKWKKIKS